MANTSKENVWVSDSLAASGITIKGLQCYSPEQRKNKQSDPSVKVIQSTMEKYRQFEPIRDDEFPSKAYCQFSDLRLYAKNFPDVFKINNFLVVSQKFVDVVNQFELGGTTFVPFEVYQHDGIERVECDYYFLNFGCFKDVFLPEHSNEKQFRPFNANTKNLWSMWRVQKDNGIAVSLDALGGFDLWIDSRLRGAFFLSERLEKALKTAKLTRKIRRHKCAVINEDGQGV